MLFHHIFLLAQALSAFASPAPKLPLPLELVYQFPLGTWVENVWVRSSGEMLLTRFAPQAAVFSLNPSALKPEAKLVASFENKTSVAGITETLDGLFAVAVGDVNPPAAVPGSFSIYLISLVTGTPKISKAADIPNAVFPNGLLTLPLHRQVILFADSSRGVVWRLDTLSGKLDIAIDIPAMHASPTSSLQLGINGIKIVGPYLYFTNSGTQRLLRVLVTEEGNVVPGAQAEIVADLGVLADDFTIDEFGTAWVAGNSYNVVLAARPDGRVTVIEGSMDSLAVAGATAAKFGRGHNDKSTLYVTTDGALFAPVNGTLKEGGKVVALDTKGFRW